MKFSIFIYIRVCIVRHEKRGGKIWSKNVVSNFVFSSVCVFTFKLKKKKSEKK